MPLNNSGDKIMWNVTITWINIFIYCIVFWIYVILAVIILVNWIK